MLTAAGYVSQVANTYGISRFDVQEVVVATLSFGIFNKLVKSTNATRSSPWLYQSHPLYTAEYRGRKISLMSAPFGSAAVACVVEELVACGAKKFIVMDFAGSLQEYAPPGTIVLPTDAIREDGASFHYLASDRVPRPDQHLLNIVERRCIETNSPYRKGTAWTTDAPFRETKNKVQKHMDRGVLAVDMCTAGLYAVAEFLGVQACSVLVISDTLYTPTWTYTFSGDQISLGVTSVLKVMLDSAVESVSADQGAVHDMNAAESLPKDQ